MSEEAQKSEIHETTADASDLDKNAGPPQADHDQRERLARKEMRLADKNDPDESSFGGVLDLDRPGAI